MVICVDNVMFYVLVKDLFQYLYKCYINQDIILKLLSTIYQFDKTKGPHMV